MLTWVLVLFVFTGGMFMRSTGEPARAAIY